MRSPGLALFIFLLPFFTFAQNQTFEIFGTITGEYYSKMYIFFDRNTKQKDSIEIKDGKFYFKLTAPLPILGRLHLDQRSFLQDVYIDGKKTYLTCTNSVKIEEIGKGKDTMNHFFITSVKGSNSERLKQQFEDSLRVVKAADKTEDEKKQAYYDRLYAFAIKYPKSKVSPYLISKANNLNYAQLETLSGLLDSSLNNTFERKSVASLLHSLDKSKHKVIGTTFYDIELQDTSGTVSHTRDVRGKYLLVDVWASWCKPCRKANPDLVALYEKFRNKDFEIVGVSIDKNPDKWKEAIIQDSLPWKHVIDSNGSWSNHYDITGIPTTILVDKEGKIIGIGLSAKEIEVALAKVL
jgi:thiol-disulfide isomerase/thioredoxin